ncbi:putative helicase [Brazilian marseillevirus]|uniref:replication n=1 Tax=Brazilian marseillevirus TaxID=1813599 RepID=UPI00078498E3|nr:replication [Brazilian marseillevirus]AMQ10530.1 putative helicase [Brazilian marseillevirus]
MEDPTKVLSLQTTHRFAQLYTLCEPETFHDNSCPLCSFSGCPKELAKHYKSKEHLSNLSKPLSVPDSWFDKRDDEDETCCYLRSLIFYSLGPLPRNIKVLFGYGTVWFMSWSDSFVHSPKERKKRGEAVIGPQTFSFAFAQNSEFFVAAQIPEYGGCRAFASYKDFDSFIKFYRLYPIGEAHDYEQIREYHKVREFYDLEKEGEWDSKEIVSLFLEARKEYCSLDNPVFQEIDSSDKTKFSSHLIGSCVFKNIFMLHDFAQGFIAWLKEHKKYSCLCKFVDASVYRKNGSLRCPGSTKYGSTRVLKCSDPFDKKNYVTADQEELSFLWKTSARRKLWRANKPKKEEVVVLETQKEQKVFDGYMEALEKFVDVDCDGAFEYDQNWDGTGYLLLKRIEGISNVCVLCSEEDGNVHDTRDAYVYIWDERLKFGCWKTEKQKYTIADFGNPYVPLASRVIDPCPFTADETYHEQHIRPLGFPNDKDCLIVRSAMGTGKTKAVVDYMKQRPNERVLILSFRISLDEELQRKFPGAVLYSDARAQKNGYITSDILVCQIDSLYRVMGTYDILVIDETSYTLSHLCKFAKNASDCWDALKSFVKNAKSVILMDAFMADYIPKLFQSLGRETWCIENTWKPHEEKTHMKVFASEKMAKQRLFSGLSQGKNIVFVSNSKKEVDAVCELAKKRGFDRVLKYTSETKKENLGISVDDWDEYQLVAYTPTISAGISFEKKHFHECHAHFVSSSANAYECSQMLFRARDLSEDNIFVHVKQMPSKVPTTKKGIISKIENLDALAYRACGLKFERSTRTLKKTAFSRLYVENEKRDNLSKKEFLRVLSLLLKTQGVSVLADFAKEDQQGKDLALELSEISEIREEKDLQDTANAEEICQEQHDEIREKKDPSRGEILSCRKFALASHFRMKQKYVTLDFLKKYRKQWSPFRTLCLTIGEKKEVDERLENLLHLEIERKSTERKQDRLRRRTYLEKVCLIREFLCDIGFSEWYKEKKVRKDEYIIGMRRVLEKIEQDKEIFESLFSSLPSEEKNFLKWMNGQLRHLFGFVIEKTNKSKNYTLGISFCAEWRINQKRDKEAKIFIPEIKYYG